MCAYLHFPGTKPLGFARYFNKSMLAYFLKKEKLIIFKWFNDIRWITFLVNMV